MPTRRTRTERAQQGITNELLEAWRQGDRALVRRLTGTRQWQISPMDAVSHRPADDDDSPWAESWSRAIEWRKRLMMVVGPPGRKPNADEP
jgi:hypothetical protein